MKKNNQQETALEQALVTQHKKDMVAYMHAHPEVFEEAIQLAVANKQPYSWRAAYVLWGCMENNDPRIRKHMRAIMKALPTKDASHQRELLKILLQMELNEKQEGLLFDLCSNLWKQVSNKPAVRYNAFKMIMKIAENHPELNNEISLITKEQYIDSLTPGARHSIKIILQGLEKE